MWWKIWRASADSWLLLHTCFLCSNFLKCKQFTSQIDYPDVCLIQRNIFRSKHPQKVLSEDVSSSLRKLHWNDAAIWKLKSGSKEGQIKWFKVILKNPELWGVSVLWYLKGWLLSITTSWPQQRKETIMDRDPECFQTSEWPSHRERHLDSQEKLQVGVLHNTAGLNYC